MKGLFITFEGGEGVGKSTQIRLLTAALKKNGFKVFITREPGGTKLGEKLRTLLKTMPMVDRAELLLFESSRAQLVESEIKPRMARGQIIISDRFADSSWVYQGLARGIGTKLVEQANNLATGGLSPHRTYLLDSTRIDLTQARIQRRGNLDRIEREKRSFHKKVALGYRTLAKRHKRFKVLTATDSIQKIHGQILRDVQSLMKRRLGKKVSFSK